MKYSFIFSILINLTSIQSQNLSFRSLSTDDGLSHFSAMTIYQDENDFIWIGTRNGMNMYNGNEIKTFKQSDNNPNSLFCNSIKQITGDSNGKLYIHTMRGIASFDTQKETFSTMLQGNISSMFYKDNLYVSIKNAIFVYNGSIFETYYEFPNDKIDISCLYIDEELIFVGTDGNGLFSLDKNNDLQQLIPNGNKISCIFKDNSQQYWVGSHNSGVFRLNNSNLTHFYNNPADENSLSANYIRTICEDKQGNIWLGTFNGLNRYNKNTNNFTKYFDKENVSNSVWSSVWSLICDHQGSIWAGTYFGSILYFNPRYSFFNQYHASEHNKNSISFPIVGKIIEDNNNNLWIGTEGGGLNKFDRKNNTFKWYKNNTNPNSISHNNVKSIYYNPKEELLWLGTHLGGLNRFDIKQDRFTRFSKIKSRTGDILLNIVSDIIPYKNILILGTDKGLYKFDPSDGSGEKMFEDLPNGQKVNAALDLLIDSRGILWIAGTSSGVYSYDFHSNKLNQYAQNHALPQSLGTNQIHTIFEDAQKRLWFLSGEKGIYRYREDTDDFENMDEELNGVSGNCVYGICDADDGNLYIMTDNNFSYFDYTNKRFVNYNVEDGFPLRNFNLNSIYKSLDGAIFIGGINGMISFFEKDLSFAPTTYKIIRTKLMIDGVEIKYKDDSDMLDKTFSQVEKITLKANQSIFSIEYTTSNYISTNKDKLIYKLEGFSDAWTKTQSNIVTFTNLRPGKYKLVVRDPIISDLNIQDNILNIEILPPFYKTFWAFLIYLILIGVILYFILREYRKKVRLHESLKYEKKRVEDIENLNHQKLLFFTNISHEFRTPLTLIIGQVEMLLQFKTLTPQVYNKILNIYKSGIQLKELITELLDFRKQEQGYMKVHVKEQNIVDLLYENYLLFKELALAKKINFTFNKTSNVSQQMQKVINNLISNAIKNTPENGEISISVRKTLYEVVIDVVDTGRGISPKDIDKIFNRFFQVEEFDSVKNIGAGIGLSLTKGIIELHHGTIEVFSELNVGTTFTIKLKQGKEHFSEEEYENVIVQSSIVEPRENQLIHLDTEIEIEPPSNNVKPNTRFRILIIEDDIPLQEMLKEIFEIFYEVSLASTGDEGLHKIITERPDIILSDILLPNMSGIELCKYVKNNIDTCHIPVVLLTAKAAIENNMEGLQVGADDYVTKPFNTQILISRCNNLINSRIILQEKFSKQPQTKMHILATNPLDMEFLNKITSIVEEHLHEESFSVDSLAQEMGIARTKLYIKLKAITGQTPYELISTIRLKKAGEMLTSHLELNIAEISDKLGFTSPRYFSRHFKEKYGVIPTEYRKKHSIS